MEGFKEAAEVVKTMATSELMSGTNNNSHISSDLREEQDLDQTFEVLVKASERVERAQSIAEKTGDSGILSKAESHYSRLLQRFKHHSEGVGRPGSKNV